jgi:hypothetical protein
MIEAGDTHSCMDVCYFQVNGYVRGLRVEMSPTLKKSLSESQIESDNFKIKINEFGAR